MKHKPIPYLITALALGTLCAQGAKPTGEKQPPPPLLLPVVDTDKNGEISAEEIAKASTSLLEADKNADGSLTKEEIAPPPPPKGTNGSSASTGEKRPPMGPPMGPPPGSPVLVKALDLNMDRTISGDEIEDAALSLAALDKNNDGKIDKHEMNPGKPSGGKPT